MTGEVFLGRWSRRKRDVQREAAEPEPAIEPVAELARVEAAIDAAGEGDPAADGEVLAALGLRHPETIDDGPELAAFLRAEVPKHLRRIALRRLWRSDPILANLDGLNDYDTDFRGGGVAEGTLRTAYRVGRGLLGRAAETAPGAGAEAPGEAAALAEGEAPAGEPAPAALHDAARETLTAREAQAPGRPGAARVAEAPDEPGAAHEAGAEVASAERGPAAARAVNGVEGVPEPRRAPVDPGAVARRAPVRMAFRFPGQG